MAVKMKTGYTTTTSCLKRERIGQSIKMRQGSALQMSRGAPFVYTMSIWLLT